MLITDPDREIRNLPDPAAVPASPAVRSPGGSNKIKAHVATCCLVHFLENTQNHQNKTNT